MAPKLLLLLLTTVCGQQPPSMLVQVGEVALPTVPQDLDLRPHVQRAAGIQAVINEYADQVFANLGALMRRDLEPLHLPDQKTSFNFSLIITYSGEIALSNGTMTELSTLHRGGDVVVSYSTSQHQLLVSVPIAFDVVSFEYQYKAKLMGLGPSGGIVGTVSDMRVDVEVGFDTATFVASSQFKIISAGHISFHFTGNPLVDWIVNILSEVVTTLLHRVITWVLETVVGGAVSAFTDLVNEVIQQILNPTTTTTVTSVNFIKALL